MKHLLSLVSLIIYCTCVNAQAPQDSTLNNLVHPSGHKTANPNELGRIEKFGKGEQSLILIAGLGFGSAIYKDLVGKYKTAYKIYSVTPAGFGGTQAPPMPLASAKYSEMTWTNGIIEGVLKLISDEGLQKPIIISSFVTGTQVALELAIKHSDKIGKVIIIGGAPYRYFPSQASDGTYSDWEKERVATAKQRSAVVESYWAPKWFKTVTKETWDANMWTPDDYCKDPSLGNKFFDESASVPVQVMVRYLIEWMTYDINDRYKSITIPVLMLVPDFNTVLYSSGSTEVFPPKVYLKYFHQVPITMTEKAGNPKLLVKGITDSRLFTWIDNPIDTYREIDSFINVQQSK